jgi:hypothetical protein
MESKSALTQYLMENLKAVHETEEADDSNEVTAKRIDSFVVTHMRIPKAPTTKE